MLHIYIYRNMGVDSKMEQMAELRLSISAVASDAQSSPLVPVKDRVLRQSMCYHQLYILIYSSPLLAIIVLDPDAFTIDLLRSKPRDDIQVRIWSLGLKMMLYIQCRLSLTLSRMNKRSWNSWYIHTLWLSYTWLKYDSAIAYSSRNPTWESGQGRRVTQHLRVIEECGYITPTLVT